MDTILASSADGTFQTIYGWNRKGLFLQRVAQERYLFRHTGSGLSLFHFIGSHDCAIRLHQEFSEAYDFLRDSTWVLKGQGELQRMLAQSGLKKRWFNRTWHYEHGDKAPRD